MTLNKPLIPCVRYLRVSSSRQASDDRFGYARQRRSAAKSEQKHGLEVVAEVLDEISGAKNERPGLSSLAATAQQHGATAISLSQVDRLSRDIPGGYAIITELLATRLDVYASDLRRRVNYNDPESVQELNERLREAASERYKIRERTYGGMLEKAKEGNPVRAINLYGYLNGEPHEREAFWVRRLFELSLIHGGRAAADTLNAEHAPGPGGTPWSYLNVHSALDNPTYKGEAGYGRELYCEACHEYRRGNRSDAKRGYGTCKRCGRTMQLTRVTIPTPALVSPEVWESANAARSARSVFYGRKSKRPEFALTGRMQCAECGRAMNGIGKKRIYYVCTVARRGGPCPHGKHYPVAAVHEAVLRELHILATEPGMLEALFAEAYKDPHVAERARVKASRESLERTLDLIEDGYLGGVLSVDKARTRRRETEASLRKLPVLPSAPAQRLNVAALRADLNEALELQPLETVVEIVNIRVAIGLSGIVQFVVL